LLFAECLTKHAQDNLSVLASLQHDNRTGSLEENHAANQVRIPGHKESNQTKTAAHPR
jgi:hypothetical protein